MKFSIQRNPFIKYLNTVTRAISAKTALDILNGIKLDLTNEELKLTASNGDISIETTLAENDEEAGLSVLETGSIVVPARMFVDIIKRLPENEVNINIDAKYQVTITSGQAAFTINGLDPNEYPHLPEIEIKTQINLEADILKRVIEQTIISVSNQENRPILTGIHLTLKSDQLVAVATDSHRLSRRQLALQVDQAIDYNLTIPGKSMNELAKMLSDYPGQVNVQISENQVLFILGQTYFYSRLLEGNYPETDRLIPQNSSTQIEFNSAEFLRAIERASLLSHEGRNNIVKLTLDTANQSAILSGNSPEVGNVEERLSFNSLTGEGIQISFNPDYMKDALRSFGQSQIKLEMTQPLRPFVVLPSEGDTTMLQLITPVRTA
ncbi:DNA polymerase III subunit beta [Ligilactobacillus sp. Marseille-Q7487]|jgi:DNA polymerase-3 subunit beta|uniref:DNA polymerase III subunit beta n=1 Tax=Ligilactobacillus sp. Marseille-Q7487 TaxID=3022128 RepID=UPI0015B66108|nr:DNA polymerase III subunit beta [Ligilactobacillus sp. Marseille-Q7487]